MNILDIARACAPDAAHRIIGIRPGEKLHEQMIGVEDAPYTYEFDNHFKILPAIHSWSADPVRTKNGRIVKEDFHYSSDTNSEWMKAEELRTWIKNNSHIIGYF